MSISVIGGCCCSSGVPISQTCTPCDIPYSGLTITCTLCRQSDGLCQTVTENITYYPTENLQLVNSHNGAPSCCSPCCIQNKSGDWWGACLYFSDFPTFGGTTVYFFRMYCRNGNWIANYDPQFDNFLGMCWSPADAAYFKIRDCAGCSEPTVIPTINKNSCDPLDIDIIHRIGSFTVLSGVVTEL